MDYDAIIVRYGEIFLKSGHTQRAFRDRLNSNISWRLEQGGFECKQRNLRHRIIITPYTDGAANIVSNVFGVKSTSPAVTVKSDVEEMKKIALKFGKEKLGGKKTFAVRARRTRKDFELTSQELEREVGGFLNDKFGNPVDLSNPEVTVYIELMENETYMFTEKIPGVGGLPYGCEGLLLALVENNDDLLACWYMMRRGAKLHVLATPEMMGECEKLRLLANESLKITSTNDEKLENLLSKKEFLGIVSAKLFDESKTLENKNIPLYRPLIGRKFLPTPTGL